MAKILPGWAIRRNGSCLLWQEVDCGEKKAPYRACCPSSTVCPNQYNTACCQAGTNCTDTIVETPRCANSSWIMYDNAGFFCCDPGYVGYKLDLTDGCSRSGEGIPDGAYPLAQINQVTLSPTTPSESTSTPTTPPTASQSNNATPVGGIVGGVVGGVALIAIILIGIFFCRKMNRTSKDDNIHHGRFNNKDVMMLTPTHPELEHTTRVELSSKEVHELS
ncbi:hypothetical protein F4806DRAFT_431889 [Annulohypoxylon nitens]|nr:hypothetical protein F4806DRAFT_431889 [Annulohypoxylon nitens]